MIRYLLKKAKKYLLTVILILVFGTILIGWGQDVSNQIVKNTILISIGTSLIASGIVAFLDLFKTMEKEEVYSDIDNIVLKAGIESVYEKRDLDEYDDLVKNARYSIDVLGYSLRGFFQSYKEILSRKVVDNHAFKVRMLLVKPGTLSSNWRENNEDGSVNGSYQHSLDTIKKAFADFNNIEIRLIDIPIGHMIYRIDDVMYVGPYMYMENSKSSNTIKLNKNGWLYQKYQNEFDLMWNDAIAENK